MFVTVHASTSPEIQDEYVELPSQDLWMTYIKNVHVVDGKLNEGRFCNALSSILDIYRVCCGSIEQTHLSQGNSSFQIRLVNRPLSVEVVHDDRPLGLSNWVVQDDLKRFFCGATTSSENSLLQIKLSVCENYTAIGVSWHHALGDATSLLRFMHTLSQLYQGLQPSYPPPSFRKHKFTSPDIDILQRFEPMMPHLTGTFPVPEIYQRYAERNQSTRRIDWYVTQGQASLIRDHTNGFSSIPLSVQDCLTSYIVSTFNRCGYHTLSTVTNAASYRDVAAPFIDANVAGNCIYVIPTCLIMPTDGILSVAQKVRRSLLEARSPNFIESYMSAAGHHMLRAATEDKKFFFGSDSNVLSVNSNLSFNWRAVHFGYPRGSKFYTAGISKFYLRVFKSNSDEAGIELSLGVPEDIYDLVMKTLQSDFSRLDFPDNIIS
ncbi:hypothetical protein EDD85DRAFT_825416 [Armillaria nabsnona]|nr:hypothetical protein EDD85DRAFT_825416 [Armillaria nabsnona]